MTANRRSRMTRAALPLLAASLLLLQPASALASPASHSGTADDPIPIHAGQTLQARMPEGDPYEATVAFELISPVTGPLTIDARSLDFDTFLKVSRVEPDRELTLLRMDDHTGDATNARIVLEAGTNARYRIEVQPEWLLYCGDEFELSVTLGHSPEAYRTIRENDWCTTPAPYYEAMADKTAAKESPGCRVENLIAESFRHSPGNDWMIEEDPEVWDKEPREFAEKAEALAREELEPGHPASLAAMDRLGHVLTLAGKYDEAVSALQRALDDAGRRYGPDHLANARIIQHLREARRYALRGGPEDSYGEGKAATKEITAAFAAKIEAALGPDHLITAEWKFGQGAGPLPDDADVKVQKESFTVLERLRGPHHPVLALSLNNLGFSLTMRGEHLEATPVRERALPLMEKACGPDHWLTVEWMNKLANILHNAGEIVRVERLRRESVEILERQDHPLLGQFKLYLFPVLLELGEIEEADELLERMQIKYDAKWGPDPEIFLWQRYLLHLARREYEDARTLIEPALVKEGFEEWLAGARPARRLDEIWFAVDLGRVYTEVGELEKARMILERALQDAESATRRMGLEDHPSLHLILGALGRVLLETGELEEARRHLERSTRLQAQVAERFGVGLGDPGSPFHLARTLAALGEMDGALGAALEAEEMGRTRLRLIAGGLPERLGLAYASVRLPSLDLALSLLGAPGLDGTDAARRAWDALIRSRAVVLDEMAARRQIVARAGRLAQLAEEYSTATRRCLNLTVRDPDLGQLENHMSLVEKTCREKERAEKALTDASAGFREKKAREILGWDDVVEALPPGSALIAFALHDRQEFSAGAGPETSRPAPPPGEAEQPEEREAVAVGAAPAGEPVRSYMAFVKGPGAADPVAVPLGPAAEIDALVAAWQEKVRRGALQPGETPAESEQEYRRAGEALRRRLWDPLAAHVGAAPRVFVVADGSINLVSLASLPIGERGYLLEKGQIIHYISAERDLVPSGLKAPRGRSLLALGVPDFEAEGMFAALTPGKPGSVEGGAATEVARLATPAEGRPLSDAAAARAVAAGAVPPPPAQPQEITSPGTEAPSATRGGTPVASLVPFRGERSACGAFSALEFDPLPAAGREVEEIVTLWEETSGTRSSEGAGVLRLSGAAASETAFKDQAPGKRVLHLATHGFFLGGECASALERRRGFGRVVVDREGMPPAPGSGENPLVLSGLALAGANHRDAAGPNEDDGILTAQEIAAMDLSGVEWAVLSACDTGVGEIQAGEGVLGLRRAFQVAGADTLIMSLWSVEDEAARTWMKALYEGRLKWSLDTAEAVRQASLRVLNERREKNESTHPFYWAGFVAAGDWR